MAETFYPFVENGEGRQLAETVENAARIAIFDDPAAAPRVVIIEPTDVRSYLEHITEAVTRLAREQGGHIPFTVIREVVENLIHAYFKDPTISILDDGNTIRFSDQGPGIREKAKALEYGTTSATEEMRRYIRGVGSGLPYAQQYLRDHGGDLSIEDNICAGTVVTISLPSAGGARQATTSPTAQAAPPQEAWTSELEVSKRGRQALNYLGTHESGGPTELKALFGNSMSTWTRELKRLEECGLVRRAGQKRLLTKLGRSFLSSVEHEH